MTAIAALKHNGLIYIGGDSAAVGGSHYLDLAATPKVFAVGALVLGYTSSFRMGYALQHRLSVPERLPDGDDLNALDRWMAVDFMDSVREVMRVAGYMKKDSEREYGGQFICGVRGQIYNCDDDFHARRSAAPFAACGSGVSACLGALHFAFRNPSGLTPEATLTSALEAAEGCVATVRGPFHIISGGARS